jgi:MYXO-CTERM domain-containing protein
VRGPARTIGVACLAAVAALAPPAAAYVRSADQSTGNALFWPMPVVPFHVSAASSAQSPTCAASAAGDPALDAARASFSAWRQGCSTLELVYAGRIDEVGTGVDGAHDGLVVFRQGFCSGNPPAAACMASGASGCGNTFDCFEDRTPGDRFIVALTSVLYDPASGRIVNADTEVNGWDGQPGSLSAGTSGPAHGWYFTCDKQTGWAACTTYGQGGCYYIDLQNTLTHEVGHFLGLAHPCGDAGEPSCASDPSFAQTTMYPVTTPGDVAKRTLSADDIAGVCAIYPDSGGGCGCGSGGAPGALAAALAVIALWPRRRATRR